jgi:hypothetical protein
MPTGIVGSSATVPRPTDGRRDRRPWDGATEPKLEHDDHRAEVFRRWAEHIEEALEESDQPMIPMRRNDLETLAHNHRS